MAANALAGVPPQDRHAIQAALAWAGDDVEPAKGEDPLVAAIKSYQKRTGATITGELTDKQRDALLSAAHMHQNRFGWTVVIDPATGIRLGLPVKLVPQAHDLAHGTRWSSPHGEVQVETFRRKNLKLSELFEREKKQPQIRRPEKSEMHDDRFSISGMQGLKYFAVHAQAHDGEVRGFTLFYDQAWEGIVEPVVSAMTSAFSAFPERSAPYAALAKAVEYGTGLVVSAQGHIVTTRRIADRCQVIVVPGLGDAERVAEDRNEGLVLLRVYGRHRLTPLPLGVDAGRPDKPLPLKLIGVPDPREQQDRDRRSELEAKLSGNAIELRDPVPLAGFSGAAVLDSAGHVLGMMETRNAMLASNAQALPPVRLVSAASIRDFLDRNHVTAAMTATGAVRDSVVRVICVRK